MPSSRYLLYALLIVAAVALSALTAAARGKEDNSIPKDIKVPSDVVVALYLPQRSRDHRSYVRQLDLWLQPGKALEDSATDMLKRVFPAGFLAAPGDTRAMALVLSLHPTLQVDDAELTRTLNYKVLNPAGEVLLTGTVSGKADLGDLSAGGDFYKADIKAMQALAVDVLRKLRPDVARFPATRAFADVPSESIADRTAAMSTGTGFFINDTGQVLTAAHVVRGCLLIDVEHAGSKSAGRSRARSDLLDLALLDTTLPAPSAIAFRKSGEVRLGEAVVNVAFPPKGLLTGAPNLARGNVNSLTALAGADGQFQFSAPVQAGSAGGPVVADSGALVGIALGTIDVSAMIQGGMLPQNTNFALASRYAAMFLNKHDARFRESAEQTPADSSAANALALASVVNVSCFQ